MKIDLDRQEKRPEPVSWERLVPEAMDEGISFQQDILRLHMERYQFACNYVTGKRVVDAACGTGYGSVMMKEAGAESVLGLDLDEMTVNTANDKYGNTNISFKTQNLDEYDFENCDFDILVSFETIEHLDDPQQFISRIHTQLPADGLFIASVPSVPTVDIDQYHKHDFSKKSWRRLVQSCGFTIVDEFEQQYRASLKQLNEEMEAENTLPGARQNIVRYYMTHPLAGMRRVLRMMLYGIELDALTLVCKPNA